MIKAGAARCRMWSPSTLPRIQRDVVMISTRRQERSLRAPPLRDFESEHAAVEREGPFEICHLQVNVPDPNGRINRTGTRFVHVLLYPWCSGLMRPRDDKIAHVRRGVALDRPKLVRRKRKLTKVRPSPC